MLLIVTPNPALDRTMVVPHLQPGHKHRAERVLVAAGGKGLNVARAANTLGQPLRVCAPLGGITGQYISHLVRDEEDFDARWSWHKSGETRTCVLLVDPHASDATPLNEHGPTLNEQDWLDFVGIVLTYAPAAALAAICGSLPPGVSPAELARLIHSLADADCYAIVDTSGESLLAALHARPYAIKVNREELGAVLSMPVETLEQAATALATVRDRGIALAVVSLGAQGALAASDEGMCHVALPPIEIISTVGSGDSLLAGLATGLLRGYTLEEAMRLGVACGTADALTIGSGLVEISDVTRLLRETIVTWL
jgi:1-phosphofructokinase family hexose kinase